MFVQTSRTTWIGIIVLTAIGLLPAAVFAVFAGDEVTPEQQLTALLKIHAAVPDDLKRAATDAERQLVLARLQALPLSLLKLAEKSPRDPVALEALIQLVAITNGTAFPADEPESPGIRALAILERDHVRSERLGPACQRVTFGFHRRHETFLRAVLETNPHREVRGLACLSLAQLLSNRRQRLDSLEKLGREDEVEKYHRVFGKEVIESFQRQDRVKVAAEIESLFVRAAEQYADLTFHDQLTDSDMLVGERAQAELFPIRELAIGKTVPDIVGEDQEGQTFRLSDYRGQVVLLYFWHHF